MANQIMVIIPDRLEQATTRVSDDEAAGLRQEQSIPYLRSGTGRIVWRAAPAQSQFRQPPPPRNTATRIRMPSSAAAMPMGMSDMFGFVKQYQVEVHPDRLLAYNIPLQRIRRAQRLPSSLMC